MLDRFIRLLRHRWHEPSSARRVLPRAALERLQQGSPRFQCNK